MIAGFGAYALLRYIVELAGVIGLVGIGAVNGLGIRYLGLPPLIMTLAMATILQGLLILIAGGSAI